MLSDRDLDQRDVTDLPDTDPGLRPLARRWDLLGLTNPSFDGGIELFCEFIANRRVNSPTCPVSTSICATCSLTTTSSCSRENCSIPATPT